MLSGFNVPVSPAFEPGRGSGLVQMRVQRRVAGVGDRRSTPPVRGLRRGLAGCQLDPSHPQFVACHRLILNQAVVRFVFLPDLLP